MNTFKRWAEWRSKVHKSVESKRGVYMRLKKSEIEAIQNTFLKTFIHGEIYLFGSRVDDSQKGGDIDLYIKPESLSQLSRTKVDFLVKLKQLIGRQKIDLVIDRGSDRLIDRLAEQKGELLWKS